MFVYYTDAQLLTQSTCCAYWFDIGRTLIIVQNNVQGGHSSSTALSSDFVEASPTPTIIAMLPKAGSNYYRVAKTTDFYVPGQYVVNPKNYDCLMIRVSALRLIKQIQ